VRPLLVAPLLCLAVLAARPASAQGDEGDEAEPEKKPEKEAPAPAPAPEPEPVVRGNEAPPLPPPGAPAIDEQSPHPYLAVPRSGENERHLDVGPDAGIWARPAESDAGVTYSPGFAWGAHLRVELASFLGFRAYYNKSSHSVNVPYGGLGLSGTETDQPALDVMQLGARLEPTWVVVPTLRLWAGAGAGWGRASASQPQTSGANSVRYDDRAGVFVEWSGALGAIWDPLPGRLATTLTLAGGLFSNQTGELFQDEQVINGGVVARIDGLPRFAASYSALLGVGVVL
jgi:hypothetical protein